MTTCEEIYNLLKTKNLERTKVDFKQSDVIGNPKGQKDLAKVLVALT